MKNRIILLGLFLFAISLARFAMASSSLRGRPFQHPSQWLVGVFGGIAVISLPFVLSRLSRESTQRAQGASRAMFETIALNTLLIGLFAIAATPGSAGLAPPHTQRLLDLSANIIFGSGIVLAGIATVIAVRRRPGR